MNKIHESIHKSREEIDELYTIAPVEWSRIVDARINHPVIGEYAHVLPVGVQQVSDKVTVVQMAPFGNDLAPHMIGRAMVMANALKHHGITDEAGDNIGVIMLPAPTRSSNYAGKVEKLGDAMSLSEGVFSGYEKIIFAGDSFGADESMAYLAGDTSAAKNADVVVGHFDPAGTIKRNLGRLGLDFVLSGKDLKKDVAESEMKSHDRLWSIRPSDAHVAVNGLLSATSVTLARDMAEGMYFADTLSAIEQNGIKWLDLHLAEESPITGAGNIFNSGFLSSVEGRVITQDFGGRGRVVVVDGNHSRADNLKLQAVPAISAAEKL